MKNISKNEYIKILGAVISIVLIIVIIRIIKVNITEESVSYNKNHTYAKDNIITNTDGSVSVSIMGNILISNKMKTNYQIYGLKGFMTDDISDIIKNTDISIMNQTFSVSGSDEKNYSVSADDLKILQDMSINMVTSANKYFRQFGTKSAGNTKTVLENYNIKSCGSGTNLDEACNAVYLTYNSKTIGLMSVMKLSEKDNKGIAMNSNGYVREKSGIYGESSIDNICDSIKEAKSKCDFLIVGVSWEKDEGKITKSMKSDAHSFIKAGADMISGCSDKPLDVEYYKDKPIIYGTGNFLNTGNPADTKLYTAVIKKNNKCKLTIHDCKTAAYSVSINNN